MIVYRYSFNEINAKNRLFWFTFDYLADFLYVCDIMFSFRTGFLEEGVLQTDPVRLRHHYMNTTKFYVDCLCLIPLDILYLSLDYNSIFRCFRLVKIYRFWAFLDRTERHTNFPNLFRTVVMMHYLFAIFHWNACFSYILSRYLSNDFMLRNYNEAAAAVVTAATAAAATSSPSSATVDQVNGNLNSFLMSGEYTAAGVGSLLGAGSADHASGAGDKSTSKFKSSPSISPSSAAAAAAAAASKDPHRLASAASLDGVGAGGSGEESLNNYLKAFYMSTKILTMVSEMPTPVSSRDYMFAIFQLVLALLLFSTIIGHVGYIVSNLGNARKKFQCKWPQNHRTFSLRFYLIVNKMFVCVV